MMIDKRCNYNLIWFMCHRWHAKEDYLDVMMQRMEWLEKYKEFKRLGGSEKLFWCLFVWEINHPEEALNG